LVSVLGGAARAGCAAHLSARAARGLASCGASMVALRGRRPSTCRGRCSSARVAPAIQPRSARRTAPARHPGACRSQGRHPAPACPWRAARAPGVRRPALASRVRHVASWSPRAELPASLLPTPPPSYGPGSQGTSTCVVASLCIRRPRPRRADCHRETPTCWWSQPTKCAAPCWARAAAAAALPVCRTAQREARSRTLPVTRGSAGGRGVGWHPSAGCSLWTTSVRTPSPLKRVSSAVPRHDQPCAGALPSPLSPKAPHPRAARSPEPA
jgi:hypothetical protein